MCNSTPRWILALLMGWLAACQTAPQATEASRDLLLGAVDDEDLATDVALETEIDCLGESLDGLRAEFNANEDKPRLVTLLSPTCSPCELGSQAVRQSVLEAYPEADLQALVVWVDVMPESSLAEARRLGDTLRDPRVRQFHDPEGRAARAFAERLLPTSLAWDVYLFYPPGVRWEQSEDRPPHPTYWSHQRGRIEVSHFHPREKLFQELHRAMGALAAAQDPERVLPASVALVEQEP